MAATNARKTSKDSQPTYRLRNGYSQAIVTLTDANTGKRRDYWLGEHGTPASHENYHRLLAEWKSRKRTLPPPLNQPSADEASTSITINELALAYWKHASSYYTKGAAGHIKLVVRLVRKFYGHSPAASFGPKDLRLMREEMIKGEGQSVQAFNFGDDRGPATTMPKVPGHHLEEVPIHHQPRRRQRIVMGAMRQRAMQASIPRYA